MKPPRGEEKSIPSTPPPAPEKKPQPEPVKMVRFDTQVLPVFQAKCINCHGGRATKGGVDLRTVSAIKRGGKSGPVISPGHADDSTLYQTVAEDRMPPGKPKLTASEKTLIQNWIASGAR